MTTSITLTAIETIPHFQWGSVLLLLDQEEFRQAFLGGRRAYFDDINNSEPAFARKMTVADAINYVLVCDQQERYTFDAAGMQHPLDVLGAFLGYMSGAVLPESTQEWQERLNEEAQMIVLEETAALA